MYRDDRDVFNLNAELGSSDPDAWDRMGTLDAARFPHSHELRAATMSARCQWLDRSLRRHFRVLNKSMELEFRGVDSASDPDRVESYYRDRHITGQCHSRHFRRESSSFLTRA